MAKKNYLLHYYKKFAPFLLTGIAANIIVDYVQLYLPEYLGQIVDIISNNNKVVFADISLIVYKTINVAIVLFLGRMIMRFGIMYASGQIEANLRHDMFLKAERLSQRYYHANKVGSIMSWFSSDLESIEEFSSWGTIMLVDSIFLSTMAIVKMFKADFILSIITIMPMLLLIIWGFVCEKTMSEKWEIRQNQFDKLYDFTQENFTGIRVIKAFVKQRQEIKQFAKLAKKQSDINVDFAKVSITLDVCIELIIGVVMSMVLGLGSYFVYCFKSGNPIMLLGHLVNLKAGDLITFIGYADVLIWPMIAMGQVAQMYSRARTSLKRISHFLDEEEEIHSNEKALILKTIKGRICFKHFNFKYPDGNANSLNDVSFEIKPGEMVGIVGKIGSGKTTLVNSLLRLYNIERGKIFIDNVDIMDLNIQNLRDNVAYVPQDNFLFSDKIMNNIGFGKKKIDLQEVRMAAKFADVDDNIIDFEQGYDTLTGERGVTLSGGQKQRISIARAYIKDAPIMIMDDAVSAVDIKTEETILKNINEKRKGKTTIIIASRVSTVKHLDKILVLNDGKVEAFGKPEELLKTSKTYSKMVFLQKLESEL